MDTPFGNIPNHWKISDVISETSVVTDYVANGSFASLAENVQYKTEEDFAVLIRLVDFNNQFKDNFVFIDENAYNFLCKSQLFGGEIIISNVGANVGTVFRCPTLKYKMALAPNSIMVKFHGCNEFYYYWLISPAGQGMIQSIVTGSAQPKFNKTNFRSMSIPVPPLSEQKKIAAILSSLDEKIETNRKINGKLEELAQAIFKSWFIDFEPFGGKMPADWDQTNIGSLDLVISDFVANGSFASLKENVTLYDKPEFAYFIRNTDLKVNSFSVYVDKHSYDFLSKSALYGGEIIISNVGDVGSVFLCPSLDRPMTLGNNIIMIRPQKNYLTSYLYLFFRSYLGQHLIDGITGGSAQPKFNKTDFKRSIINLPNEDILIRFEYMTRTLLQEIEFRTQESAHLAALRDTLLPKLMSGEIEPGINLITPDIADYT